MPVNVIIVKNYCLACDYLDLSTKILFRSFGINPKKKLRFGTYLKMMMASPL
ncbi:hypothetical protein [Vagococcus martis]|uniref:hypothetical protein n=1 Tax=Vagococcus martis TaxID=1768210 RepID=UPI001301DF6B|nr:hypothetical protein [Vagococcus martis]